MVDSLKAAAPHLWPIEDLVDQTARTMSLYEQGLTPGDSTGLRNIDKFYTVAVDQWTLVTGFPGSGKSELLDQFLVNLAEGDWQFALYSPENQPSQIHVAKLAEKRVRKPFGRGPTERMTRAELGDAIAWIQDRFVWLAPDDANHLSLLASAMAFRRGHKKFAVVLDPWNALEHKRPSGVSETDHIGMALTDIMQWVRRHHMHVFLVAHPQKIARDSATGKRPVPSPYDIAGSANWWNKADNIVCVDRDQGSETQDVQVYIQKVKYKHIGRLGRADLKYDRVTGRYHDAPGSVAEQALKDF